MLPGLTRCSWKKSFWQVFILYLSWLLFPLSWCGDSCYRWWGVGCYGNDCQASQGEWDMVMAWTCIVLLPAKKTGKKSFKYLQTSTTTYFILCEIRSVLLSMKSAALWQGTRTEPAVGVKSGSCPDLQPYTGLSIQQRPSGVFGVVPPEPALLGKSLHQAHNCLLHPKHGTFHRVIRVWAFISTPCN